MSAKLEHIDLWRGDHIYVRANGSVEINLLIAVDRYGKATVSGPLNCKSKTFEILATGLREIEKGGGGEC